ncbi:hypothetical protein ERHA55_43200 [Erwinia rhapontici]|nr:hypothetical protein ERHA55_43200 [Erwinia rhapontici]
MKHLQVAVGIIRKDGEIFLAQRSADSYMANRWEFPGGKWKRVKAPNRR